MAKDNMIPNSEPVKGINDNADIMVSGKPRNRKSAESTSAASKKDTKYENPKMSMDLGVSDPSFIAGSGKPMNEESKADVSMESKKNTKYKNDEDSMMDTDASKIDDLTRASAPKTNVKGIRKNS
jgi:hypothetical protein